MKTKKSEPRRLFDASKTLGVSYAQCPNCREVFFDDLLIWQCSIRCPNPQCLEFALIRGLEKKGVE